MTLAWQCLQIYNKFKFSDNVKLVSLWYYFNPEVSFNLALAQVKKINCDLLSFERNGTKTFNQNLLPTLCTLVTKGIGVEMVNKTIFQIIQNSITSLLVLN